MFFGMQDFNFTQSSLQFCPNFALILPKSNQICPNLTNFAQTNFASARWCGCIPSSYVTVSRCWSWSRPSQFS